jgi:hypothetical protein
MDPMGFSKVMISRTIKYEDLAAMAAPELQRLQRMFITTSLNIHQVHVSIQTNVLVMGVSENVL